MACTTPPPRTEFSRRVDLQEVRRGRKSYEKLSSEGKAKIYRQKMTKTNRETLQDVLSRVKRQWAIEEEEFPNFCQDIHNILAGVEYDMIENMERSSNGTKFLFYHVQRTVVNESSKYDLVLCYLTANTEVNENEFVGGLVTEGYMAVNRQENIYLL